MQIQKMIADLREERARLDEALVCLVKLSQLRTPRRGRPPKWSKEIEAAAPALGNGREPAELRVRLRKAASEQS